MTATNLLPTCCGAEHAPDRKSRDIPSGVRSLAALTDTAFDDLLAACRAEQRRRRIARHADKAAASIDPEDARLEAMTEAELSAELARLEALPPETVASRPPV